MTTKQKILSKDIWVRTAETQPFFAFLSIIQNFSLGEENKLRDKAFPRRIWAENGISLLNPE